MNAATQRLIFNHSRGRLMVVGENARSAGGIDCSGDLTISTTTRNSSNKAGANTFSQTGIDRVAGLYVSAPAGVLLASAGRDLNLTAAQIINQGSGKTELTAGNNLNLNTVQTATSTDLTWNATNYLRQSSSQEVGSSVSGGGAVNIAAQNNINLRAAGVNAQGELSVSAKQGSVTLEAGQSEASLAEARQIKSRSTFSSKTTTTRSASESTTAQVSELGGQTVAISSGQDTRITGSNVIADQGVSINAAGNVTVEAAQNTQASSAFNETKKSGLMSSGGIGITLGKQSQSLDQTGKQTTAAASTVGSTGGNVTITAGQTFTQTGSDILTPAGNIDITAQTVNITEARETSSQSTEQRARQSGLTLAITSPVLSSLQTASSQLQAAGNTSSGRMQALAAANTAMNLKQGADAIQAGQGMVKNAAGEMVEGNAADKAGGIGISLSLGSSSSRATQSSSADTARGSSLAAGGNIGIQATGAGANSDLTIQGSRIAAGQTTSLQAQGDINLLAAANTSQEQNSQSSKSGSIGLTAQLGAGGANMGVTASASRGTGQGTGTGTTFTNTQVSGNTVSLQSGADTNVKGAVVTATQFTATVGGNLTVESLQDSSQYKESSKSAGGSVTIGPAPGGSVNVAASKIKSDFNSVGEQSAIRAGDGGFQVNVQGNTALTGGQITSTQAAIDQSKNTFTTGGTLSTTDLQNQASFEAKSVSIGVGTTAGKVSPSGVGIGSDKGSSQSTTTAGISGVAGNTAARTGDASTSIKPIFNKDQVRQEVDAQVAITSEFGKQVIPIAAKTADQKAIDLRRAGNEEEAKKWDEGGIFRTGPYTALGGLTSGAAGAAGAAVNASVIPTLGEEIAKLNLPEGVRQVATQVAGIAVGAAVGGAAGVSATLPQTAYNYVSHSPFANVRKTISQENARLMNQCGANCTEQDFKRIDQQMVKLEVAGNLTAISQNSKLTTAQAVQLGETIAALLPVYGTPIAAYQAITGQSLSGQELSTAERFFNGVAAAIPAGSAAYKVMTNAAVQAKVTATVTATAERALVNSGGVVDKSGNALIDMSKLSNEQKGVMGDLFGANTVKQIVPDGQKIARVPGVGEQGLDDLYKVNRPDVDYVNIEYKFVGQDNKTGAQVLKSTVDGKQGSTTWIGGSGRIENAVGADKAIDVDKALRAGRVESWVVTVRPDGSTAVQVLDALGKPKPTDQSKIILPFLNLSGARK